MKVAKDCRCFICYGEPFELGDSVVELRCQCLYWAHEECMSRCVVEYSECPTCCVPVISLDPKSTLLAATLSLPPRGAFQNILLPEFEAHTVGHMTAELFQQPFKRWLIQASPRTLCAPSPSLIKTALFTRLALTGLFDSKISSNSSSVLPFVSGNVK